MVKPLLVKGRKLLLFGWTNYQEIIMSMKFERGTKKGTRGVLFPYSYKKSENHLRTIMHYLPLRLSTLGENFSISHVCGHLYKSDNVQSYIYPHWDSVRVESTSRELHKVDLDNTNVISVYYEKYKLFYEQMDWMMTIQAIRPAMVDLFPKFKRTANILLLLISFLLPR